MSSFVEQFVSTPENSLLFQQEYALVEFTDLVAKYMRKRKISTKELSQRIGKSEWWLNRLLQGLVNPSLRDMSTVMFHLGKSLSLKAGTLQQDK